MPARKKPATPTAPVVEPSVIRSRDLADFLADALLFSDLSGYLPVLDGVMLTAENDRLVGTATDRYILGQRTLADWTGRPAFDPFLLNGSDAADIVKILRSRRAPSGQRGAPVDLSIGADLTLQVGPITIRCARKEGEFPKYAKLMKDADDRTRTPEAGRFGVNPRLLAKFGRLSIKEPLVVTSTGPEAPITFRAGNDFRGILMPVRMASFSNEVAA